ncbi:MAG: 2Fe-2S iron-sulfur cluster binding domain-containing protein, partial [Proteobacteria bacterium]|nr:2Fe-2S iron-sulfur cluster binding domain-containing protein [Pseudomonadota bacterium]
EALFNAAFGDRLNPLYQLGAICYFLFWVVAGSGLYLYAFYETSVSGAYASVEALTHGQWYAGGILRSVHRYASDAMVLTMLLHLVRHFAFDRLRGFRWFSWVTGVALVWLVYVSGINGFMLVWDRLAQFVVVASFEWLDWLPTFGGALIRNFIYPDSVNDRLFSLLAFMHIGIPLLVLLLMWIHVQRVPKANTNPARPVMAGLLATMLVLALAKPVLSQGGAADLGVAVSSLAFDWFYLPVFPLLYAWPLAHVWALLAGATLLLAALPWLPPRLARAKATEYRMRVRPGDGTVTVRAGETLLEAGLRAGIALPYECRNGGCGVCRCTIVQGSVDHGAYQPGALTDAMRSRGEALLCCATPLSDVEIALDPAAQAARAAVPRYTGRVDSIELLSAEVARLMVSLPEGRRIDFTAGQYINILLADGQRRAFSFANPPHANERIELHVRLIPGGRFTTHVFTAMQAGDPLEFEGPLGTFALHEGERPILFVAGATGFAPIKSIVEDAFHRGIRRPMCLYWGVKHRSDLYLLELAERWQREHANFTLVPVLSEPGPQDAWAGRTGLVHTAMLADHPDLTGYEVYVCGSVNMVQTAIPAFLTQGLREDVCFSDAFAPAAGPRPAPA